MATTVSGPRAGSTFPVSGLPIPAGVPGVAWGTYTHASNLAATTTIGYCRVPAGATVIGGFFQCADLDTGTEELDIDIGWDAYGDQVADPDGFGNLDVLTGDASVHLPVAGIWVPFAGVIQSSGYKTFTHEAVLMATINVDAAMGGTGVSKMVAWYV